MFSIIRDKSFQLSFGFVLALHVLMLFSAKSSLSSVKSEISVSNSESKVQLNMQKRVVTKRKKKKLVKRSKKIVSKKELSIEKETSMPQSAIMKTRVNKSSTYAPKPRYPRMAIKRGIEGSVLVKILINEQGIPYEVSILKSSGFKLLDDAAKETAMQWKFSPALVGGKAVKSQNHQPFVFSLQSI